MKEVLKNEDLLEKFKAIKTYPLKLKLTDIQRVRIENMFYEYKKVTDNVLRIILNEFFPKHLRILSENDIKDGICESCKKNRKLTIEMVDFEFIKYAESKKGKHYKPIYKKGNKIKICENCYSSHYSLRKFLYTTSSRNTIPIKKWDIKKGYNLGNAYDSCVQKAVETIKSQEKIKKIIKKNIEYLRQRIITNNVMKNSDIKENFLDFIETRGLNEQEGIKLLNKFIKKDSNQIEKEKGKISEGIKFRGDVIRLYEKEYQLIKDGHDFFIKLKDYTRDKWMTLEFYGKNYQKKLAKEFVKGKNAETEIVRKGDDYFLQYIYNKAIEIPKPDETFNAVGIDLNLINLACFVAMKKDLKPIKVKFYSGRYIRSKRARFSKVRGIWNSKRKYKENGGKGRSMKWFLDKVRAQNEKKYIKFKIHELTTHIVREIHDTIEKPVIVLEDLRNIRKETERLKKIEKSSINNLNKKQQKAIGIMKSLMRELNNWNFSDVQKFIDYKSKFFGIPVVYVPAKNTTIKCNKCGYVGEDIYEKIGKKKMLKKNENVENYHQLKFKCKKCGYQCNLDFNAGVNIARSFYETLKIKNITFHTTF